MGQSPEELRRDIERTRAELGDTIDTIGDRVSPRRIVDRRRQRVRESFSSAKERVMGTPRAAMHQVSDTASQVGDSVGDTMSSAVDTVRSVPDMALERTEGSPVAAGMIAFGAGLLIAALIPPSEAERRAGSTVREKIEPLKDTAMDMGHEIAGELKESAKEASDHLKEHAKQATQEVTADARDAAHEVKANASS